MPDGTSDSALTSSQERWIGQGKEEEQEPEPRGETRHEDMAKGGGKGNGGSLDEGPLPLFISAVSWKETLGQCMPRQH